MRQGLTVNAAYDLTSGMSSFKGKSFISALMKWKSLFLSTFVVYDQSLITSVPNEPSFITIFPKDRLLIVRVTPTHLMQTTFPMTRTTLPGLCGHDAPAVSDER